MIPEEGREADWFVFYKLSCAGKTYANLKLAMLILLQIVRICSTSTKKLKPSVMSTLLRTRTKLPLLTLRGDVWVDVAKYLKTSGVAKKIRAACSSKHAYGFPIETCQNEECILRCSGRTTTLEPQKREKRYKFNGRQVKDTIFNYQYTIAVRIRVLQVLVLVIPLPGV